MENFKFNLETLWKLLHLVYIVPIVGILLVYCADKNFDQLGPFGDFVAGSTVPILTFVSFLAVVITMRMQGDQLKMQEKQMDMQREELKNSIEEMKAQRMEFEDQNKTLKIQRFENTFFQMVNLHHNIVEAISISDSSKQLSGRRALERLTKILKDKDDNYKRGPFPTDIEYRNKDFEGQASTLWLNFYNEYENILGHYFRNLYRIAKYIDETNLIDDMDEKKEYIGILRAQLSSAELILLLHNSLGHHGKNFLVLMYKYNMLDNLNSKKLIDIRLLDLFTERALNSTADSN